MFAAFGVQEPMNNFVPEVPDSFPPHPRGDSSSIPSTLPLEVRDVGTLVLEEGEDLSSFLALPDLGVAAWFRLPDGREFLGLGEVDRVEGRGEQRINQLAEGVQRIALRLQQQGSGPLPGLLGGFAFSAGPFSDPWSGHPDARLILPRLWLERRASEDRARVSLIAGEEEDVSLDLEALWREAKAELATGRRAGMVPLGTPSSLPRELWRRQVQWARGAFQEGRLEKVVLARAEVQATECSGSPFAHGAAVAGRLARRYPGCYVFGLRGWASGSFFFGASPERLVKVAGGEASVSALAGSVARGSSAEEDRQLTHHLETSPKEEREHRLVREAIVSSLEPLSTEVREGAREVWRLPNIQHLHTPVLAQLRAGVGVLQVAAGLHPTPAVAGWPVLAAREAIRHLEPVPRGWYAGAVGWVDMDGEGELAVSLRCGLMREGRVWTFAGAGLVEGSEVEAEWRETTLKLLPVQESLNPEEVAESSRRSVS